jgi:branched-chain amino acid transport system substrate-binding protein
LQSDQLGYDGVKFDETGQNVLSATYLIQLHSKTYQSVWPPERATSSLAYPMTGWRQ